MKRSVEVDKMANGFGLSAVKEKFRYGRKNSNTEKLKQLLGQRRVLLVSAILVNLVLFLLDFAFYNAVYATNDDYRMSLIVSGAYTGSPESILVFMNYIPALIVSVLYRITAAVPWYGIATELCIFIPCCIFLYFALREFNKKGHALLGLLLYVLLYAFVIQKHVVIPQFTLTAAFTGVGALALLWYLPEKRWGFQLAGAAVLAVCSFCIRQKVFLMVVPVILLMLAVKLISCKTDRKSELIRLGTAVGVILVSCLFVVLVDYIGSGLSASYREFNTLRSLIYDFGSLPDFESNREFYAGLGIDKALYYAISMRYLDVSDAMTAEVLRNLVNALNEIESSQGFAARFTAAFSEVFGQFLDTNENVLYQFIFAFVLYTSACVLSGVRRQYFSLAILLATLAGIFCETAYLCFISRVIDRLLEVYILTLGTVSLFILSEAICEKNRRIEKTAEIIVRDSASETHRRLICGITVSSFIRRAVSAVSIVILCVCLLVSNQNVVASRSENQNNLNERLEILNAIAASDPDSFYFYDAYDFIAASSDVFAVYDGVVNTDSLGTWYARSDGYYERNASYGFTTAIEGLTGCGNVYFAAIGNVKYGIVYILRSEYDMELQLIRSVPYYNNTINIYRIVPCG